MQLSKLQSELRDLREETTEQQETLERQIRDLRSQLHDQERSYRRI